MSTGFGDREVIVTFICTNDTEIKVECRGMSGGKDMRTNVNNSLVDWEKMVWCHFAFKMVNSWP